MSSQETQQVIAELRTLRAEIRRWRVAAAVVTAAMIIAGLLVLKISAWGLFETGPKHDQFVTEVQRGLVQDVAPQVKGIATDTMAQLIPRVKDEIVRVQLRSPEIRAAIVTEFDLLNKHLPACAEQALGGAVNQMLRGREQKIVKMFPGLDATQMAARMMPLLDEGQRRALKVGNQIAAPYAASLGRIVQDLEAIRASEAPTIPDNIATLDLAAALVSVLQDEVRTTASQNPRLGVIQALLVPVK